MTFSVDLKWHINNSLMTSLIYKKYSDFLFSKKRWELFSFVNFIKILNWRITIKTSKPIVNAELKSFEWDFVRIASEVFVYFWLNYKEIKIRFV